MDLLGASMTQEMETDDVPAAKKNKSASQSELGVLVAKGYLQLVARNRATESVIFETLHTKTDQVLVKGGLAVGKKHDEQVKAAKVAKTKQKDKLPIHYCVFAGAVDIVKEHDVELRTLPLGSDNTKHWRWPNANTSESSVAMIKQNHHRWHHAHPNSKLLARKQSNNHHAKNQFFVFFVLI